MQSVANSSPFPLISLLLVALLSAGAFAAQARSSIEVSVQVVRRDYSTATAALVERAATRDSSNAAINSDAECKAIGSMVIVDDVSATCGWDPDSHMYLVTIQY